MSKSNVVAMLPYLSRLYRLDIISSAERTKLSGLFRASMHNPMFMCEARNMLTEIYSKKDRREDKEELNEILRLIHQN